MRRKTPQEKKRLSYERDQRNCYGEAPHAARKWIPRRKAMRNRANRHYQNQQLNRLSPTPEQEFADELESLMNKRAPKEWDKSRDWPLGEVVAEKMRKREVMRMQGGRRALIVSHTYFGNYSTSHRSQEMIKEDAAKLWYPRTLDVFLNRWFANYEEARKSLQDEGGFLLPYKHQFFVCQAEAIRAMGLEPDDPDWERIGWDCAKPADAEAYQRLYQKREQAARDGLD